MSDTIYLATALPPELLGQIFRAGVLPRSRVSTSHLPRLALVCKTWLPVAQEELYRTIHLQGRAWGSADDKTAAVANLLSERDDLATFARTVVLKNARWEEAYKRAVGNVLRSCRGITSFIAAELRLFPSEIESLATVLEQARPQQLRQVVLYDGYVEPLLPILANLETLQVIENLSEFVIPFGLPTPSFRLSRLVLTHHARYVLPFEPAHLDWLVGHSPPCLTQLALPFTASTPSFDLSSFTNLIDLTLSTTASVDETQIVLQAALPHVLSTLSSAKHLPLRLFHLHPTSTVVDTPVSRLYTTLLAVLPPSVEHVDLGGSEFTSLEAGWTVLRALAPGVRSVLFESLRMERGEEKVKAFEALCDLAEEREIRLRFASGQTRESVREESLELESDSDSDSDSDRGIGGQFDYVEERDRPGRGEQ
ncbi:hypothetical protein JCM8547_006510 [Rhodosporidiobolus lusitaniae]